MKLDLILENIRSKYSLGLLEESSGEISEKELLKGKLLINESTMAIRKMLVEENGLQNVKNGLKNHWGKIAGVGAAGTLGYGGKLAYDAGKKFVNNTRSGIADAKAGVDNNAGVIAGNTSRIATNDFNIDNNAAGIDKNSLGVSNNVAGIDKNATGINNNAEVIAGNTSRIANIDAQVPAHTPDAVPAHTPDAVPAHTPAELNLRDTIRNPLSSREIADTYLGKFNNPFSNQINNILKNKPVPSGESNPVVDHIGINSNSIADKIHDLASQ